jgi:sugar/nucleoside kinase (ribokinase family)
MDLIIVGDIARDVNIFTRASGLHDIVEGNGGACYYAAAGASRYDKVGVVSKVGADFDMSVLDSFGIDHKGVQVVDGLTTRFYQHFTSVDGQEREFRAERNPYTGLSVWDIPPEYLEQAKYIMLSTTTPDKQLLMIDGLRHYTSAKIAVDTLAEFANDPVTRAVFDRADIAFIDREFQGLVDCNAPEKILKLGKEGSVYYNGAELYEYHTPDIIENVVDKTGAGDVLSGTFLSVLAKTNNPELALKIANQVATESIKAFGVEHLSTAPLPTLDQGGGPSK